MGFMSCIFALVKAFRTARDHDNENRNIHCRSTRPVLEAAKETAVKEVPVSEVVYQKQQKKQQK